MHLLLRLRYLLEVLRPPLPDVARVLGVLTRMARHSLQAASEVGRGRAEGGCSMVGVPLSLPQVMLCPRLMDTIFREFLPLTWSEWQGELPWQQTTPIVTSNSITLSPGGSEEVAHGWPQPAAMKLMQLICSAGRNLTAHLVSTLPISHPPSSSPCPHSPHLPPSFQLSEHKLMEVILCYVMLHPSDLPLPLDHAHTLSTAALRAWRAVLSYGLAPEAFRWGRGQSTS